MINRLFRLVLIVGIIVILLAGSYRFILRRRTPASIITSSTLIDAIDIAELSTAEFKYKGIAEVYSDEERTKVKCRLCYNAVVKAGINMDEVGFDIDESDKTIIITLPDIDITVTIVDEQSMAILPSDADVGIPSMLKYSKEDAENEANKSEELIDAARDNLKATIEGLLYPVLKPQGYSIKWN